jgi:hypothetical protein
MSNRFKKAADLAIWMEEIESSLNQLIIESVVWLAHRLAAGWRLARN